MNIQVENTDERAIFGKSAMHKVYMHPCCTSAFSLQPMHSSLQPMLQKSLGLVRISPVGHACPTGLIISPPWWLKAEGRSAKLRCIRARGHSNGSISFCLKKCLRIIRYNLKNSIFAARIWISYILFARVREKRMKSILVRNLNCSIAEEIIKPNHNQIPNNMKKFTSLLLLLLVTFVGG